MWQSVLLWLWFVNVWSLPQKECDRRAITTGSIISVTSVHELEDSVGRAGPGTTILLSDGIYPLTRPLYFNNDGVVIRSKSGNRSKVILTGKGMTGAGPTHIIQLSASDVVIADLTIGWVRNHGIQVHGETGAMRPVLHNIHIIDCGQQLIKVSAGSSPLSERRYSDGGLLACSRMEYTENAPSGYTNGIDILAGKDWVIRDNEFVRIKGPPGQLGGAAILCWKNCINTIVERNLILECDKGIAFGNPAGPGTKYSRNNETRYDHQGGIVRNNVIARMSDGDTGIEFNRARDFGCYHNTVYINSSSVNWAIEYRFPQSNGKISNNLTNLRIFQRDDGQARLGGNVTNAEDGWFVNVAAGNLQLTGSATAAVDKAYYLPEVTDDFNGNPRPNGRVCDIGAIESN